MSVLQKTIDLRSDGVTRPSVAMRNAMRDAVVGDDVYGDDPTVNALEAEAAQVFEREAAVFLPSGTMANQVALFSHVRRGQEIVCEAHADIYLWEMALPAILCGCLIRPVHTEDGCLTWASIAPLLNRDGDVWKAETGLITVENPNNMAGGVVQPRGAANEICTAAHALGIPVHLDGARIFNAATALGATVAELTRPFDSIMFCLSKGLGAPVGSMLVGDASFITRARRARKMIGGGMRQCGVLAAAGLIALREGPSRLHLDHEHARAIAERLQHVPGVFVDPRRVATNVVHLTIEPPMTAPALVAAVAREGLLVTAVDDRTVRLVTHLDVDVDACLEAAARIERGVYAYHPEYT